MNILNIVNTIQKLKAGLIALYDNQDNKKVELAKFIFLGGRMVPLEEKIAYKHKNDFSEFLGHNYLKSTLKGDPNEVNVISEYLLLRSRFTM